MGKHEEEDDKKKIKEAKKTKKHTIEKKHKDRTNREKETDVENEIKTTQKKEREDEEPIKDGEIKEPNESKEKSEQLVENEKTDVHISKEKETKKSKYKQRIDEITTNNKICNISPICDPILKAKYYKKFLKLMDYVYYARIYANKILTESPNIEQTEKKICKTKFLYVGILQVHKAIKQKHRGILLLALDVFPVDIICHLPALCEENHILYTYVTTKNTLAKICKFRRSLTCLFIPEPSLDVEKFEKICHQHGCTKIKDFKKAYEKFEQAVSSDHPFYKSQI